MKIYVFLKIGQCRRRSRRIPGKLKLLCQGHYGMGGNYAALAAMMSVCT